MKNKPYISFVVTSRNDNHGGDMINRMKIFTKGLIHQCNKFKLKAELIFVEWNPIEGEPLLKDILPLPQQKDYLNIRFIIIPNAIHQTLNFSDKIPLFQMIAKNVGIKRVKSEFVLCTNVDLLFSDELIEFISLKTLKKGVFYRANRCDIPKEINPNLPTESLLTFAKNNILQRLGKSRYYPELINTYSPLYKIPIYGMLLSLPLKIKKLLGKQTTQEKINEMDTNACGDFTLMSTDDWEDIQGYFELEAYSIHIDSLAIYAALALNKKQEILHYKKCTFHISHENGWEMGNPLDKIYFDIKNPMLDWSTVESVGKYLIENNLKLNLNKPTWGFSDKHFKEYIFEANKEMQEIN